MLGLGVVGLRGLLHQRPSPYGQLLAVALDPDGLAACFDETTDELRDRDHGTAVGGNEGRGGLEYDHVLAEFVEEGCFDVGMDPELVVLLAKQDPALELWLVAIACVGHTCGVASELDHGQD